MGTRLYPKTENPEILEALTEVPTGTYNKVDQLNKAEQAEMRDLEEAILAAQTCGADHLAVADGFQEISHIYCQLPRSKLRGVKPDPVMG